MASLLILFGLAGMGAYLNKNGISGRTHNLNFHNIPGCEKPNGDNVYNSYRFLEVRDEVQNKANDKFLKGFDAPQTNVIPQYYHQIFKKGLQKNPDRKSLPSEKISEKVSNTTLNEAKHNEQKHYNQNYNNDLQNIKHQSLKNTMEDKMQPNQYNIYNNSSELLGPTEKVTTQNISGGFQGISNDPSLKNDWIRHNTITKEQYAKLPNAQDGNAMTDNQNMTSLGVPSLPGQSGLISGQFRQEDYQKFGIVNPESNPKVQNVPNWQYESSSTEGFNPTISGPQKNPDAPFHNNMTPYFGSHRTQNLNRPHDEILENFTGQVPLSSQYRMVHKKELPQNDLFAPQFGLTHPYGTPNLGNYGKDRHITSQKKTNQLPTNQIRVGPGLNQEGYGSKPVNGFHSTYRPPQYNVDDLRTAGNPKLTYHGRVLAGKEQVENRGFIGETFKNKPDTFFVNSENRYFTSVNPDSAKPKTTRPENFAIDFPLTDRQLTTQSYGGIGGPINNVQAKKSYKSDYNRHAPLKSNYYQIAPSGVNAQQRAGVEYDYGLSGQFPNPNHEDDTPLQRNKEHMLTELGFWAKPQERNTTESKLGNQRLGVGTKQSERQTMPLFDRQKTTIKETLPSWKRAGGVGTTQNQRRTMGPFDRQKTTKNDTLPSWKRAGIIGTNQNERQTMSPFDRQKTTKKETLPSWKRAGGVGTAQNERQTMSPFDRQKTTKKETLPSWKRGGAIGNSQMSRFTNRQATNNMEQSVVKESTLRGRRPTKQSVKNSVGSDQININIKDKYLYDQSQRNQIALNDGVNPGNKQWEVIHDRFQMGREGTTMNKLLSEGIRQPENYLVKQFRENPYSKPLDSVAGY